MAIVNFSVPKVLDSRIKHFVRQKGFASRAELFRFAVLFLMDFAEKRAITEEERTELLTRAITDRVVQKYQGSRIPSIEEQLRGL